MRSAEGLEALPLFQLDLSSNKMETIDGCADLGKLIELDLSNNNIKVRNKEEIYAREQILNHFSESGQIQHQLVTNSTTQFGRQ